MYMNEDNETHTYFGSKRVNCSGYSLNSFELSVWFARTSQALWEAAYSSCRKQEDWATETRSRLPATLTAPHWVLMTSLPSSFYRCRNGSSV